ncbi:MAG TPA: hypothetical protein VJR89_29575 [Polyangiales bacterium]|nr:hypothetical protein [Polyangiales bacterium]
MLLALALADACADDNPRHGMSDAAVREDPFRDSGFTNPRGVIEVDDAGTLSPDAFFIDDPPPPYCGEDGKMEPAPAISGTRECPGDKNREGCPCDSPGQRSLCWPGQRVNRNHGVCHDGMTRCIMGFEFGNRWGPCEDYELPVEGATTGPDACRCFSNGTWSLTNLVPCIAQSMDKKYWVYSSHPDEKAGYLCNGLMSTPPPAPPEVWTSSTLKVDCSGRFKLCYTIKAGDVTQPKASDCVLVQSCIDTWYARAGSQLKLPDLPGWTAKDQACAQRFVDSGGYGEMSVIGRSSECEAVDDGDGQPYVFKRASYCPPRCATTPNDAECMHCSASGAGDF